MHQYTTITNIISVKLLNFKIVYCYRSFKDFMLNLFYDYIFAVE